MLEAEKEAPNAGNFFRYYNPKSKTAKFEQMVCEKTGSKYALAVNSGTSALVAALVAAGVGPGDEVIVPAYTFFASASAVVPAGRSGRWASSRTPQPARASACAVCRVWMPRA